MVLTKELEKNERLFNLALNKFVIFCHSYPTIVVLFKLLRIIKSSYSSYRVTIVVNMPSLFLYLERMFRNDPNIGIYEIESSKLTLKKPFSLIKEIILKYKLLHRFRYVSNANIIFSSKNYVFRDYFILQILKLNKSNNFCYIDKFYENVVKRKKAYKLPIIKKLGLFFLRKIYGRDLGYYSLGNILFIGISDSYLNTFKTVRLQELGHVDIDYKRYKISVPYKIIYFDDDLFSFSNRILDLKKFKQLLVKLFSRIEQVTVNKDEIGIKFHPGSKGYLPILRYGSEIKSHIPAEFLIANECKIIFTVFSTVLNSFRKDVVRISIIDLLPWSNQETYRTYKNLLIEDREECLIPKSIGEFIKIVSKIICKS